MRDELGDDGAVHVAVGAVASIVTDDASVFEALVFPAASETPPDLRRNTTVPSVVQVTVTVIDVPLEADGLNVQEAVPVFVKSSALIPLTLSEKVRV